MKKLLVFQIILALSFLKVIGQVNPFIAGEINDSITYFDFIPDTILYVSTDQWSPEQIFFFLDLNMDGTDDFSFHLFNGGGNSGWSNFVRIESLNDNGVAFSHYSLSSDPYGWGNDSIYTPVAKIINFDDIIDNNLVFSNEKLTLCEYSWLMEAYVISIPDWNITGEKYIAVCLNNTSDCLFGWIKVSSIEVNSITIESFALNESLSSIQDNIMKNNQKIKVGPNPSYNYINIMPQTNFHGIANIIIFDLTGKILDSKKINLSTDYKINLNNNWKGIYLLKIECDDYNFSKKIIIK